jgi:hypothetical protein
MERGRQVVQRSAQHKTLLRLLEIAEVLQTQSRAQRSNPPEVWLDLLRTSYQFGQGHAGKKNEIDSLLLKSKLDDDTQRRITQWLLQLPQGEPISPDGLLESSPRPAGQQQVGGKVAETVSAPVNRQDYDHRKFTNDLRTVIGILQQQLVENKAQAGKKVRLVFLIDEVDELNRYSERTNQRLRRKEFGRLRRAGRLSFRNFACGSSILPSKSGAGASRRPTSKQSAMKYCRIRVGKRRS